MTITPTSSTSLDPQRRGYPRPQLRRDCWFSLNGRWDFAFDDHHEWKKPSQVTWSGEITVPFAPEAPASGIGRTGFLGACWYRRHCELARRTAGERWILHFGAVDFQAIVWINGTCVGGHEGGYTPFAFDITDLLLSDSCEIVVRAEDDPHDLTKSP